MDKKTIVGIAAIAVIILLLPYYQRLISPNPPSPSVQKTEQQVNNETSQESENPSSIQENIDSAQIDSKPIVGSDAELNDSIQNMTSSKEEIFKTIENDKISVTFSSKGCNITKLYMKEYKNYAHDDDSIVQLIPASSKRILNQVLTFGSRTIDLSKIDFSFSKNQQNLVATANYQLDGKTISIKKEFVLVAGKYDLLMNYEILSDNIKLDQNLIEWDNSLNSTENNLKDESRYYKSFVKMGDVVTEEKIAKDDEKKIDERSGNVHWVSLKNKYFLIAMIAPQQANSLILKGQEKEKGSIPYLYAGLIFKNDKAQKGEVKLYLGPIEYSTLKSYDLMLEKNVDMGFTLIRPFSVGITWLLIFMSKYISNYGLIIILFAIIIKIITFPFTHKSYEATKRMSELQPKLAELKEKYAKDPQKLNKATMELYKKEGVNPLGGCLPMLFQMPIFFGLYRVFASTIMLRGQSFLWIENLSIKDPYMALPILMGILTFVQNKLTMKDPKQKMMVYFMPIFLFFIFKNFASGLVLYWTCFNLFSILQQELINKFYHKNKLPAKNAK